MGLRFRRRIRLAKGLYLNVSKSGVSASVGGRGATVNLSRHGTRTTVGLPGSGLSYRSPTRPWGASSGAGRLVAVVILATVVIGLLVAAIR
jgi:hypothetical protein